MTATQPETSLHAVPGDFDLDDVLLQPATCTTPRCGAPLTDDGTCPDCARFDQLLNDGCLLTIHDLENLPPLEPLIDGHLSLRETVLVPGKHGSYKSFLALDWGLSIATGRDWQGHATLELPVMYVVKEGVYGLDKRITAWSTAWAQPKPETFHIFRVTKGLWGTDGPRLDDVKIAARRHGARVVILDTLSSLFGGAEEKNESHMSALTSGLDDIRNHIDGTVMLVHHSGWGAPDRARGSSALEANVDTVISVVRDQTVITVKTTKRKDDVDWSIDLTAREIPLGTDPQGHPTSSLILESHRPNTRPAADFIEQVFAHIPEAGVPISVRQLLDALHLADADRQRLSRALGKLVDTGRIEPHGKTRSLVYTRSGSGSGGAS